MEHPVLDFVSCIVCLYYVNNAKIYVNIEVLFVLTVNEECVYLIYIVLHFFSIVLI